MEVIQEAVASDEALDRERLYTPHRAEQPELPHAPEKATEGDDLLLKGR